MPAGDPTAAEDASERIAPLLRWLVGQPDPVAVHLTCPEHGSHARVPRGTVVVRLATCLHDLPVSALLEVVLAGARSAVLDPSDCPRGAGGPGARVADAVAQATGFLAAAGRATTVEVADDALPTPASRPWRRTRSTEVLDLDRLPLSRRTLLTFGVGTRRPGRDRGVTERDRLLRSLRLLGLHGAAARPEAAAPPAPAALPEAAAPPAPAALPDAAASPEPAARPEAAGTPAPAAGAAASTGPVAVPSPAEQSARPSSVVHAASAVLTAAGCTACGTCARVCPEDALTLEQDGATALLVQVAAACTDCGRCVDLCPVGAMTRTGSRDLAAVLDAAPVPVVSVPLRDCARCGTAFGGAGGDLCPVCAFRRAHPFGSAPTPGAQLGRVPV